MKTHLLILFLTVLAMTANAQPRPSRAVEPLMTTTRTQHDPYNRSCPYYNYGDSVSSNPCLVGCVATAIEQLLSFYRYPYSLQDSIAGWETEHYKLTTVDKGTVIDWEDVADLSLWCGMMVKMNYTPNSSASSMWRAEEPLKRVMGYGTVRILDRSNYSFDNWHRILQNELLAGRPVAYVGYSVAVRGHAFNIDGVNGQGLYHCNWGEGVNTNGYFSLEHLNEGQPHHDATELGRVLGCHANQYMLILHPDSVTDILLPETLFDYANAVKVDSVRFLREIDNREYVMADVTMTNLTEDTLYQTYLVMQNAVTDTALTKQCHNAALSSVRFLPKETVTQSIPCHFTAGEGECLVSISFDGKDTAWSRKQKVVKALTDDLAFKDIDISFTHDGTMRLVMDTYNIARQGTSGRLVYYRLFRKGMSHTCSSDFRVLNLPAGETVRDTLSFHMLEPGTDYVLKIGNWNKAIHEVSFTMPPLSDGITDMEEVDKKHTSGIYDLQGRPMKRTNDGAYIKNGRVYVGKQKRTGQNY